MNDLPITMAVDDAFFLEETRCGFLVDRQRKEVWAIEIDLLHQLDEICKKHGLCYCAGAGTMLGAVRHGGFIPWDDDIDLYMPRKDYDRLIELSHEFADPYFLQVSQTEPNMARSFAKLRNAHTTGANGFEARDHICLGIFIDIMPLDGISPDARLNARQRRRDRFIKRMFHFYNSAKRGIPAETGFAGRAKMHAIRTFFRLFRINGEKLITSYERNLSRYSVPGTEIWGNRTIHFDCPRSRRPLADYTDLVRMPFEYTTIPVPRNYDAMLHQQYGDYMQIPENKGGNLHGDLIIDTRHPYEEMRRLSQ